MKRLTATALVIFLTLSFNSVNASEKGKNPEKIAARKISTEELKTIGKQMLSIPLAPVEECDAGNTNYVYTITNMLYGAEHFSAFVDPRNCYVSSPGVVRAKSINIILYATADIINCSGFEIQAHIEAAEWSGNCPSPGYEAQCTSDYTVMQITSPGLYLISFPLNEDCLRYGPFFASITFFNDGGCLPGPLNIVVDDWPEYCNSYNNYDGTWYDIVASYGLIGKLSLFATVEGIDPVPVISSVEDVPDDQGGAITLRWRKSVLDSALFSSVTHYAVWRRLPDNSNVDSYIKARSAAKTIETGIVPIDFDGTAIRTDYKGSAWEWMANIPSHSFDTYAFTVQSLYDSAGLDPHWQYFMVTACTDDPFIYWDSAVDSGYSVDNLSPAPPENLTGTELESAGGLLISWSRCKENDFKCYRLYRSEEQGFALSNENLITTTSDTFTTDTSWNAESNFYYKLVAEDIHGNISDAAELCPGDIVVGTTLISYTADFSDRGITVEWKTSFEPGGYRIYRKESGAEFFKISPQIEIDASFTYRFTDNKLTPGTEYIYRINYIDENGEEKVLFETDAISVPTPGLALYQNHPNPFNPSTTIEFYLPEETEVRLTIFNSSGLVVRKVIEGGHLSRGIHSVKWDGRDESGNNVSSGVYYCRLSAAGRKITKKMVLIR